MRFVVVLAVLLAGSPALAEGRLSIGYYASFVDKEMEKIPWDGLTHVCHAFLQTDEKGELVTDERMPSRELTKAGHERGAKVLLSLGGGRTSSGLQRVTASRESIQQYVPKILKVVADYGYDGVEVHWEFPHNRETRGGFVSLVGALRSALDEQAKRSGRSEPYELSAAVSPSGFFGKWIDVGAVLGRLDWITVLAYDMSGSWDRHAGHSSPLFPSPSDPARAWRSASQAMTYWSEDRGVAKEKLVLGVPFFGRAFPIDTRFAELDATAREQGGAVSYTKVRELVGKGWPAEWDEESQVPWLSAPKGEQVIVAFEDRNSIDKKARWAQQNGYRGLAYWAIHQDRMSDGTHWLLKAAERAWPVEK